MSDTPLSEVVRLTRDLIARPSITPEDAGCQRLVTERLLTVGCDVEWLHFGAVSNVVITHGKGQPSLWFLGHTDVVPPGPEADWSSPPFAPEIRDGVLFGRGAADMKGAVAAMVVAMEEWITAHPQHAGQVGLLLTSDEEGVAADGVRRVAEVLRERGSAPDHCLVGEPSCVAQLGDTVRIGRRGSVCARLEVDGVQGHTAFPHLIDNPVHRLAPFLAELVQTRWDDGDADFPATHCQISNVSAGAGAENVTPGHALVMFNFRNSPASPEADIKTRLEAMLAHHGIETYRMDWRISGQPFRSEPGALHAALPRVIERELGIAPELNTGGGTSDGRFIAPLGTEVMEFGVLNRSIHKVDEQVAIADLERLQSVYQGLLSELLVDP